jgi:hypothetical protein
MAIKDRSVLHFESDGIVLRVVDMEAEGLAFTTGEGSAPKGIILDAPALDVLDRFIQKWRGRGVA